MYGVRMKKAKNQGRTCGCTELLYLMADTCGLDMDEIIQGKSQEERREVSGRKSLRT